MSAKLTSRTAAIWTAVVVAAAARDARAGCPVTLEGDSQVVSEVEAALALFGGSDAPCVTLRVMCRADDGAIEIDLHDELGRAAHRRFATIDGAATFLVSWSRRPLPDHPPPPATATTPPASPSTVPRPPTASPPGPGTPPAAPTTAIPHPPVRAVPDRPGTLGKPARPAKSPDGSPPPSPATIQRPAPPAKDAAPPDVPGRAGLPLHRRLASADDDPAGRPPFDAEAAAGAVRDPALGPRPTQFELHIDYLRTVASNGLSAVTGAVVRNRGIWRYGGELRFTETSADDQAPHFLGSSGMNDVSSWLGTDLEATFGVAHQDGRFMARAELTAGGTYVFGVKQTGSLSYQTAGGRAGVRTAAGVRVAPGIWVELGGGWDALIQSGVALENSPFGYRTLVQAPHAEIGFLWAP